MSLLDVGFTHVIITQFVPLLAHSWRSAGQRVQLSCLVSLGTDDVLVVPYTQAAVSPL